MSIIRFQNIFNQVLKYAKTQKTNAKFAFIRKFYGIRKDKDNRYYAYAKTYSTRIFNKKLGIFVVKKKRKVYDTFIMVRKWKTRKPTVVLSCSCPDFKYRHEVALAVKGGAEITYSNGRRPRITNPRMRATCCKHCLRLYEFLSRNYPELFTVIPKLEEEIGKGRNPSTMPVVVLPD